MRDRKARDFGYGVSRLPGDLSLRGWMEPVWTWVGPHVPREPPRRRPHRDPARKGAYPWLRSIAGFRARFGKLDTEWVHIERELGHADWAAAPLELREELAELLLTWPDAVVRRRKVPPRDR